LGKEWHRESDSLSIKRVHNARDASDSRLVVFWDKDFPDSQNGFAPIVDLVLKAKMNDLVVG